MKRTAFTIIELLVVITIIVVLLALLTPALDSAIYQAELAVCAANHRAVATGGQQYAFSNKRRYPTRGKDYIGAPNYLRVPQTAKNATPDSNRPPPSDLRPQLRKYVSMDVFLDPLAPYEVDLSEEANDDDTYLVANGFVFFGWGFNDNIANQTGPVKGNTPFKKMEKVGDRFIFVDDSQQRQAQTITHRYAILSSDRDLTAFAASGSVSSTMVQSTHPDKEGLMAGLSWQNEENSWELAAPFKLTASWYFNQNGSAPHRGTVDMNFAKDDGSVQRVNEVEILDQRLGPIASETAYDWRSGGFHSQLPEN